MRVLLSYSPISTEDRYLSAIGSAGGRQMPLGIFYLATLRKHGHEVVVIDAEAENLMADDYFGCESSGGACLVSLRPAVRNDCWHCCGACRSCCFAKKRTAKPFRRVRYSGAATLWQRRILKWDPPTRKTSKQKT
jgi:hypothetical protein